MSSTSPNMLLRPDAVQYASRMEQRSLSSVSPAIRQLYKVRRLRGLCLRVCQRLEGGAFFSETLRHLLQDAHDVGIGRYSYGSILKPGVLPPGSRVGAYCSVGSDLIVRRRDHPIDRPVMHPFFYNHALGIVEQDTIPLNEANPLEIGNDVWIGDRVTILSGCRKIGNGAVLAAGAVITRDIAPYSIVGGVPAKPIRMRFSPDQITHLEESQWWTKELSELIENFPDLVSDVSPTG